MSPHRNLNRDMSPHSIHSKDVTPLGNLKSTKSTTLNVYRNLDPQERKNSTIWDAITMRDYEKFKREQDAKLIEKREQQVSMRNYLDNQMKVVESRK